MNYRFAAGVAIVGCSRVIAVAMRNPGAGADDGDRTETVRAALRGGTARNVILFIGDGMGDSEITAARNYEVGPGGRLALDTLPLTGAYTTYSVEETNPEVPDFVTDSAASGTAWATGHKTSNDRISTSASDDRDLPTILELTQRRGYRTATATRATMKTDRRNLVNAIKIATYNAEWWLARRFFRHYQNPHDWLTIFRSIIQLPGVITIDAGEVCVTLHPPDRAQVRQALAATLQEINTLQTRMGGDGPILRFGLAPS